METRERERMRITFFVFLHEFVSNSKGWSGSVFFVAKAIIKYNARGNADVIEF